MQNKLQELTEKIYQEGVEKGNVEAQQIVEKAKTDAADIIAKSKKEAEAIISEAKKKADELKTNTESEIKLSGKQALNALKQKIADLVSGEITSAAVKEAFDKNFIQKIIETTLSNWAKSGQNMNLALLLPVADEKRLADFFKKEAKQYIDKGITVTYDSAIETGFQIGPKDGSYKVSFTEEDFINFFKNYLRPKLVETLFS